MDELPENAVDVIEDMSRELKGSMLQEKQDTLRDSPSSSAALLLAEQQKVLFTRAASDEGDHEEDLVREYVGPAVCEILSFFTTMQLVLMFLYLMLSYADILEWLCYWFIQKCISCP